MQDAAGTFADDWIERGIIDISWDFDGLDIASMGREQIRAAYASTHPAESKQKIAPTCPYVYSTSMPSFDIT